MPGHIRKRVVSSVSSGPYSPVSWGHARCWSDIQVQAVIRTQRAVAECRQLCYTLLRHLCLVLYVSRLTCHTWHTETLAMCHNLTHTWDTCYVSCVACVTTLHTSSGCWCVPVCSCVSDCRNNLITAGWCFAESDTDTAWVQPHSRHT